MAQMLRVDRVRVEATMSDGSRRVIEMGQDAPFFRCAIDLGREVREIEPGDFTTWRAFTPGDRVNLTISASGTNAAINWPQPRAIEGS